MIHGGKASKLTFGGTTFRLTDWCVQLPEEDSGRDLVELVEEVTAPQKRRRKKRHPLDNRPSPCSQ